MTSSQNSICTQGWEALRGDSLGWLLDETRPNLHWRVLVELIGRPAASPAVRRARDRADSAEPVASLLTKLEADGEWLSRVPLWVPYRGFGWRFADPGRSGEAARDRSRRGWIGP
jgi:hypothetical protein